MSALGRIGNHAATPAMGRSGTVVTSFRTAPGRVVPLDVNASQPNAIIRVAN